MPNTKTDHPIACTNILGLWRSWKFHLQCLQSFILQYVKRNIGGIGKFSELLSFIFNHQALDGVLRDRLGKDIHCQINELTSQLKIKGIHKDAVVTVLKQLGF